MIFFRKVKMKKNKIVFLLFFFSFFASSNLFCMKKKVVFEAPKKVIDEGLKETVREWAKDKKELQNKRKEMAPLQKSRKRWCWACIGSCLVPAFCCASPVVKHSLPIMKDFLAEYPLYVAKKLLGNE